jgi:plastocyanin
MMRTQPRRRTPPTPAVLGLAMLALLTLAGCGRSSTAATPPDQPPVTGITTIQLHDRRFQPAAVQLPAGTTVTWQFTDGHRKHNVTGDGWSSPLQSTRTYTHTFNRPGAYAYRCTLHPGMEGRVVVT